MGGVLLSVDASKNRVYAAEDTQTIQTQLLQGSSGGSVTNEQSAAPQTSNDDISTDSTVESNNQEVQSAEEPAATGQADSTLQPATSEVNDGMDHSSQTDASQPPVEQTTVDSETTEEPASVPEQKIEEPAIKQDEQAVQSTQPTVDASVKPEPTAPVQSAVVKSTNATPVVSKKLASAVAANEKATITINGANSFAGMYDADSNPQTGTPKNNTIKVSFSGINQNDVLKIVVPNFFNLTDGPEVSGFTKSLSSDKKSIIYTAKNSGLSGNFDLNAIIQTLMITSKTINGDVTLSLNNTVIQKLSATATYGLYNQYAALIASNNASGDSGKVKVGENFVSRINNNGGNFSSTHLNASTYEDITYTIPVPKGYQLDLAATQQFNKLAMRKDNSYFKISQAAIGSNVIITVDSSMFSTSKNAYDILQNPVYFVGKLTTEDTTAVEAPKVSFENKIDNMTEEIGSPFSVSLIDKKTSQGFSWNSNVPIVYVTPNDLGAANVSPNSSINIYTWDNQVAPSVSITIDTPENTIAKGLKLSDDSNGLQQLLANGMSGKVNALDKNGNVIGTIDLKQLAGASFGQVTWLLDSNLINQVSRLSLELNDFPGRSFGSLSLIPIYSTTALPNGTKTVPIAVKITDSATGESGSTSGFVYKITDSHTIYGVGHGDALTYPVSPGATIGTSGNWDTTYNMYVDFTSQGATAYQVFDKDVYIYLQLPSNTTFVRNVNSKVNYIETIYDRATGINYAKFRVSAGTKFSEITGALSVLKVSEGLTPDMQVKTDGSKPMFFIAMQDGQIIDPDSWKSSSGKVYGLSDLEGDFSSIAADLKELGITTLYGVAPAFRQWPVTVPNVYFVSDGIKNNNDPSFVSGDDHQADFSIKKGEDGTIRLYGYNGTNANITNYNDLLTLPKKGEGSDFSLILTGPVSDYTAGTNVLYSTKVFDLANGAKLSASDLVNFITADQVTDWSIIRSILFQAASLTSKTSVQALVPVKVSQVDATTAGNKFATAQTVSYTDLSDSSKTILKARMAVPATVIINYVDKAGNSILSSETKEGIVSDTVTLNAPTINGYEVISAPVVDYQYTDASNQKVDFVYDLATMNATVNLIDSVTGANLGTRQINGKYTTTISLRDSYYTQVSGYTADSNNAQSYVFTNSASQTINLYFNPVVQTVNVYFKNQNGVVIAEASQLTGYKGNALQLEAKSILGYIPRTNKTVYNVTGSTNQSYTFIYDGELKDFTVTYQLADGKKAPLPFNFGARVGDTFNEESAKINISGYHFAKVLQGLLQGTISVDGNNQVIVTDSKGNQLSGENATTIVLQYKPIAKVSIADDQKVYDGLYINKIPTINLADGMVAPTFNSTDFLANGVLLNSVKDAATYQLSFSDGGKTKLLAANDNIYDFTDFDWSKVIGLYVISPAQATITAPNVSKTYDGQAYTGDLTPTITGVVKGDTLNYTQSDLSGVKDAGTYAIDLTLGTNKNYDVSYTNGELVINKAQATITAPNVSKTYDGQAYTGDLTPTITGVVKGDTLNYTQSDLSEVKDSGTYAIDLTLGTNKNYDVSYTNGELVINKAQATITAPNVSKTYDGQAYTGDLTPTITGVVNGDALNYTQSDLSGLKDAGTYAIDLTLGTNKNYDVSYTNGELVINKAQATITAPNVSKTYDGQAYTGDLTPTITGVVKGDALNYTQSDLSGLKDAGTYAIDLTLGTNKNYDVSYTNGELVINKAQATITADSITHLYDGKKVAVKYAANNPILADLLKQLEQEYVGPNAGEYKIDGDSLMTKLNANFDIHFIPGIIKIVNANDSISTSNKSSVYEKTSDSVTTKKSVIEQTNQMTSVETDNIQNISADHSVVTQNQTIKEYPKTGEKENHFGLLGVIMLGITGFAANIRRKKD